METEMKELNKAGMSNKLFWISRTFGNKLKRLIYSDNKVTMTYDMKSFLTDDKEYRYPEISVRKNNGSDYSDNTLNITVIVLGYVVMEFSIIYLRDLHVWEVISLDVYPEGGDTSESIGTDEMDHIADSAYSYMGEEVGTRFGGLSNTVDIVKKIADDIEVKLMMETKRKEE